VAGVPKVAARGQGGLLDVTIAPDFARTGTIFFTYFEPGKGGAGIALARARLVRDTGAAHLADLKVIFRVAKKTRGRINLGSRVVVMPDGTLMVTTGDTGDADRAQDMRDDAGAVIRINQDGSIPADNPSPDGSKWLPELWSKGHRNAQGAIYDPVTSGLLTVEHGAMGGDEVNHPEAGKNYGWPVISYGVHYSGAKIGEGPAKPGMEQPVYYWEPVIAPSGMTFYTGEAFPGWQGSLLIGSLQPGLLVRLTLADGQVTGEERYLGDLGERIRDVRQGPDGRLYLLTDNRDGRLLRVLPAAPR
jgi:glucose/arabinose dehydrogenase